jgi:hypothetical protein
VLFLDDDPQRADAFLAEHPHAVWVQTAAECIARLAEPWDEVHLDHDLGGEQFVDFERDDCGMAVVRWICLEPRQHLRLARFQVHSHNAGAATMMGMQLLASGFTVELRPFGAPPLPPLPEEPRTSLLPALVWRLRRLFGREPTAPDSEAIDPRHGVRTDEPQPEKLDLSWTRGQFRRGDGPGAPPPGKLDLSWASPRPAKPSPTPQAKSGGGPSTPEPGPPAP